MAGVCNLARIWERKKLCHSFGNAVDLLLAVCMLVQEMADMLFHLLDIENFKFPLHHIRKGIRDAYGSGHFCFQKFCKGYKMNPQFASLLLIVKFICHKYDTRVSHYEMSTAVAALSKYHITDNNSGANVGKHPLVTDRAITVEQIDTHT